MASSKEIRNKIKSVKNTQQITRAMEMVAASKMRRAQDRMQATRPYADAIKRVVEHVSHSHPEYRHPFLVERPVQHVGVMVVSSDRGLCGGLNVNLFRQVLTFLETQKQQGVKPHFALLGQKADVFFKRIGGDVWARSKHLGDAPDLTALIGPIKVMLDAYLAGKIDAVYVAYNRFVNTMTQEARVERLLPLAPEDLKGSAQQGPGWDYLYEPDPQEVLDQLLVRYIESVVYQAVVENVSCEQAARMVAMKAASDNAGDLISELKLVYNKARQAQITQELSEIVSGAAAV